MTYDFLQHYWWLIVSLLGAILVFLMFVQGANSMVRTLGWTAEGRRLVVNSTGRKWEFTFTTLVTFGGAFFASFPLFYSTSFGGAYWLWMIILFSFVLQAVTNLHFRAVPSRTESSSAVPIPPILMKKAVTPISWQTASFTDTKTQCVLNHCQKR